VCDGGRIASDGETAIKAMPMAKLRN